MTFDRAGEGASASILFFGDPHGSFGHVIEAVQTYRPKAIILLGDLTPDRPLHEELQGILNDTEIWFIHGNHDSDETRWWDNISTNLVGTPLEHRNLHGRVETIAGLRVAGQGGIFRAGIWNPKLDAQAQPKFASPDALVRHMKPGERWRGGVSLRHRASIFPSEIQALASQRADILVTHEGPSLHRHGFAAIDWLASSMGVRHLVHGHLHENVRYEDTPGRFWTAWCVDGGSFLGMA